MKRKLEYAKKWLRLTNKSLKKKTFGRVNDCLFCQETETGVFDKHCNLCIANIFEDWYGFSYACSNFANSVAVECNSKYEWRIALLELKYCLEDYIKRNGGAA